MENFDSKCLHTGFRGESNRAHNTPISISSTYYYDNTQQGKDIFLGNETGYVYQRYGNPNSDEIEKKIAALESHGIEGLQLKAIVHSSGLAALTTLFLSFLQSGDKILANLPLYGGTQDIITIVLEQKNISHEFVDLNDIQNLEQILKEDQKQGFENAKIKLIHAETPNNPITRCVDIENLTILAHKYNVKVSVDSTYATPYLQQPFKYGVDFVMHSATKFLNGHGTCCSGILLGKDLQFMEEKALKYQRTLGNSSSGFDCFLLNQGIKTLSLRMDKHCSNAIKVADFLKNHDKIEKLWFLGHKEHPDHEIAKKQMRQFGSMMAFEIKGGYDGAVKFMDKLKLCIIAVSLGTAETLICHPASTTHYQISEEKKALQGITGGFIRLSVGIEHSDDIIQDLEQSLKD